MKTRIIFPLVGTLIILILVFVTLSFSHQTTNLEKHLSMLKDMALIVTPFVTAYIGFWGAQELTNMNINHQKETTQNTHKREVISAASDVISNISAGYSSMTWVLWIAQKTPEHFSYDFITDHDKRMLKIYESLSKAQTRLASYDRKLFKKISPLIRDLYKDDAVFANLAVAVKENKPDAVYHLGTRWDLVNEKEIKLPKKFSKIIGLHIYIYP